MIPQKLVLKNFLSHPHTVLNLDGLHTACICGVNGAGKSSLLEAITWALWGKTRVDVEDDLIYLGAKEAQVDFVFLNRGACYRVIRTRSRGNASTLEVQILSEGQYRSITERGVRATQQSLIQHLKMDYETFIHSSYLRQGKADAFMLKRPQERKQVLAEILQLSQYDRLAEKAKDRARLAKGESVALTAQINRLQAQIDQTDRVEADLAGLRQAVAHLKDTLTTMETQRQQREQQQQHHGALRQKQEWLRNQNQQLTQDRQSLEQQQTVQYQQCLRLEKILAQRLPLEQRYAAYQAIAAQEAELSRKYAQYQTLVEQKQQLEHQGIAQVHGLQVQQGHYQAQWDTWVTQQQELSKVFDRQGEIEAGQQRWQQAREQLSHYDRLHSQAAPLQQRCQVLQRTIDQEKARLVAQREALERSYAQLQQQFQQVSPLKQSLQEIDQQIEHLQKKQVYQQRVHEKGLERRDFLERLKVRLAECEQKLDQTQQNMQQMREPNAPCPLCERPLEGKYWEHVHQNHQTLFEEIQAEIWLIKEQQSTSEVEINILREEYGRLRQELQPYGNYLEQKGSLQSRLEATQQLSHRLEQIQQEMSTIDRCLTERAFCVAEHEEMHLLTTSLGKLGYDERDHALLRNEADRWRWAEVKSAELKQAKHQWEVIAQKLPQLQQQIELLSDRIAHQSIDSDLQQQIHRCDQHLQQLGYDPVLHQSLREQKDSLAGILLEHQELTMAEQQYPLLQQQYVQTQGILQEKMVLLHQLAQDTTLVSTALQNCPDRQGEIAQLTIDIQTHRTHLEQQLHQIGKLEQLLQQRLAWQQQLTEIIAQKKQVDYDHHIHQELALCFGKNGIPTLVIETIIPQIEAEANQILGQLTNYQFNLRFITQKSGKKSDKFIDTLEIEIADHQGTRPYETYSGGEAFRINFAVRLALSRILAQRTGGTLQTLIIDEGFGSQDQEGCARLVSAIEAISADFACILVITHIPQLKEAFPTLIEVHKTNQGSHVQLLM